MPQTDVRPRRSLSPRARWTVPLVAAAAVGLAFAAPPLLASADSTGLPTITPEQLAAQVAAAPQQPLSGTVVYTARLGLPSLPFNDVSGADPVSLLGGSSTMRVWARMRRALPRGPARGRVRVLGRAGRPARASRTILASRPGYRYVTPVTSTPSWTRRGHAGQVAERRVRLEHRVLAREARRAIIWK